jgi:copper homeostasis protein
MTGRITLEICVDSSQSALAAQRGGADRLELCASLFDGGTTPSAGMIATVRSLVKIDLYVMIRPRSGDFCYSADEFAAMQRDIAMAKQLRADGIVFGILNPDGSVDAARCRQLLLEARPLKATFHRAFDMTRDLPQSLEDIIALGFDRVLTSGGEQKVNDAIPVVRRLREIASNRIALMLGSGVRSDNARELISQTGVRELHASARHIETSAMQFRNEKIRMGTLPDQEYQRAVVDEEEVRRLVRSISSDCRAFPLT